MVPVYVISAILGLALIFVLIGDALKKVFPNAGGYIPLGIHVVALVLFIPVQIFGLLAWAHHGFEWTYVLVPLVLLAFPYLMTLFVFLRLRMYKKRKWSNARGWYHL